MKEEMKEEINGDKKQETATMPSVKAKITNTSSNIKDIEKYKKLWGIFQEITKNNKVSIDSTTPEIETITEREIETIIEPEFNTLIEMGDNNPYLKKMYEPLSQSHTSSSLKVQQTKRKTVEKTEQQTVRTTEQLPSGGPSSVELTLDVIIGVSGVISKIVFLPAIVFFKVLEMSSD